MIKYSKSLKFHYVVDFCNDEARILRAFQEYRRDIWHCTSVGKAEVANQLMDTLGNLDTALDDYVPVVKTNAYVNDYEKLCLELNIPISNKLRDVMASARQCIRVHCMGATCCQSVFRKWELMGWFRFKHKL